MSLLSVNVTFSETEADSSCMFVLVRGYIKRHNNTFLLTKLNLHWRVKIELPENDPIHRFFHYLVPKNDFNQSRLDVLAAALLYIRAEHLWRVH